MHDIRRILESSSTIHEGVRFGRSQAEDVLSRSSDFKVGIEYEIRPVGEIRKSLRDGDLNGAGFDEFGLISAIDRIEKEHDFMTEVITHPLSLSDAINHIKNMFRYLTKHKIEVPEMAGMHISISSPKLKSKEINFLKFYLLMNSEYFHKIFPERSPHVISSMAKIRRSAERWYGSGFNDGVFNKDSTTISKETIKQLEHFLVSHTKYQSINIGDYHIRDGRIELRFFGGENYHTMFEDIKFQLLRSLFLLEIAYTDRYQKEYYKEVGRLITEVRPTTNTSSTQRENTKKLIRLVNNGDAYEALDMLQSSDLTFDKENTPLNLKNKLENLIVNDAAHARKYATIIGQRFKEAESTIAKSAADSVLYAKHVIRGRFIEAEDAIFNDSGRTLTVYLVSVFGRDRAPKDLENRAVSEGDPHAWVKYLSILKDNGIFTTTAQAYEMFPSLSVSKIFQLIEDIGYDKEKAKELVKLAIINPDNFSDTWEMVAKTADKKTLKSMMSATIEYVGLYGEIEVSELAKEKITSQDHAFIRYLKNISDYDKISFFKKQTKDLADFIGSEENIWERYRDVINNKPHVFPFVYPITEKFRELFKAESGLDI